MNIKKLLEEIEAKKNARAALVKKSEASQDVNELRSLQGQIKDLSAGIEFMKGLVDEARTAEVQRTAENAQAPAPTQTAEPDTRTQAVNEHAEHEAQNQAPENRSFKPGAGFTVTAEGRQSRTAEQMEQRGRDLKEGRSLTVATGSIILIPPPLTTPSSRFPPCSMLSTIWNCRAANLLNSPTLKIPRKAITPQKARNWRTPMLLLAMQKSPNLKLPVTPKSRTKWKNCRPLTMPLLSKAV